MSSPLVFVRDGRTLPFVPVTTAALAAIAAAAPPRRLAYARSLYLALLEVANERRSDRAAMRARVLGERAGMSRSLVSELRPLLEQARVVEVRERRVDNEQLAHEWVVVEPGRPAPQHDPPSGSATTPVAPDDTSRGRVPPAVNEEERKKDASHPTSSASRPDTDDRHRVSRELFDYWRHACGHRDALPSKDRLSAIGARLREGYREQDIRRAIDGAARAPFVNANGKHFDELELICRNGSKLEDFMARAGGGEPDSARAGAGASPERRRSPVENRFDRAAGLLP